MPGIRVVTARFSGVSASSSCHLGARQSSRSEWIVAVLDPISMEPLLF